MNTCVSEFDTLLNVYAGDSLNDLGLAARDDSCPLSQDSNASGSTVTFDVREGTSYKIAIFSYFKTIQETSTSRQPVTTVRFE